ncbi:UNVERIFIED_CONTAM: Pyrroline-5-carboxylate reductase [Sesamum radiatum]|uniref:Pyrroline-5-carboxylate reductase n=1 Tax=Sesamum radiatum TaxID=300843 RepID=A0AAW2NRM0_SESRA
MANISPIPTESYNLGFIGAGKMAESIARGVVKSGVLSASHIRTAHRGTARRTAFESFGVKVLDENSQVVQESDVVVFSVKPQVVKDVVQQLRPLLSEKKLLVSVAAGVKLKDLQFTHVLLQIPYLPSQALLSIESSDPGKEWAGHGRFIRVMPNTPAAVGVAASADEKLFDAIMALSGSGPAYIYLAIEALADGGVAAGLPRELALGLASQTVLGAASMAVTGGKHPGQLKDDVASPGGTTIAGIHELEKAGFRGILMNAVVAAAKRSRELSQS